MPVLAPLRQVRERPQRMVNAVLRTYQPNVDEQVLAPAGEHRIARDRLKLLEHRAVAYDEDILRRLVGALDGKTPYGVVGYQCDIGERERHALESPQRSPYGFPPRGAARVQLGHQIMMIEDQSSATPSLAESCEQEEVRRVARLDDAERTVTGEALYLASDPPHGRDVLADVAEPALFGKASTNRRIWMPSIISYVQRDPPRSLVAGASTVTSHPPRRSETASCQTRRSPGTSAFSTMIRARRGRAGAEPVDVRPTDRRGARVVMATAIYAHGSARLHIPSSS